MATTRGSAARWAGPARTLPATLLLAVVAVVWFVVNWDQPRGPQELGWVAPLAAQLVSALVLWETGRMAGLAPAAQRFWRQIAVVALLCGAGLLVQLVYAALDIPVGVGKVPPAAAPFFVFGLFYAVWALLRVPVGISARGEWIRLSLDVATVTLGTAVFLWFVTFGPLLARDGSWSIWAPLIVGVACLVSLSAVIKILLVGIGPLDRGALQLLGAGLLLGGVCAGAVGLVADKPQLVPGQVLGPPLALLVILAGERQRRAVHTPPRPRSTRRAPAGLLPYTAVAATDVLLIVATMVTVDERRYVVVAGAIVITALVVARQVVAVSDNDKLVVRLRNQEDQLRHQASHDVLTQLANRVLFSERLDTALADDCRDLTVLLIDLDDFKSVNDTLGHTVGDQLLAAVAGRIKGCVRAEATVARLGGDEFAVLLRDDHVGVVDAVSDRVLASLAQPIALEGYELLVQASIGVASAHPGDDAEALLRNADIAMYAAKERGKGSFAHYAPGMAAGILEQAQLGAQLRQALEDNQLFLLYQPVVRLADRHIIGMEALVRWQHPTRGLLSPMEFIPAAERTGLIVPLGRWVLQEACRQKAAWREAYGDLSPATVGVNVSGRQLREPGFADEVADAVRAAELEPHNLVLEVTETAILSGHQVMDTLHALKAFGVCIALDDFGTGQSSLSLIRTCPVHILKLDKSFVLDAEADADNQIEQRAAVARAVADLADALGLDAVAEGIESEEQAEHLVGLGYRLGQGFHLVRPLPAADLGPLLAGAVIRN